MKPDHLRYLLDEKGEPYQVHDVHEWAAKFPYQHQIALDVIHLGPDDGLQPSDAAEFVVSTVFLGVKGLYDLIGKVRLESIPMLFETIVFGADGKAVDGSKYDELDQAKRGHADLVARWRKLLGVDPA